MTNQSRKYEKIPVIMNFFVSFTWLEMLLIPYLKSRYVKRKMPMPTVSPSKLRRFRAPVIMPPMTANATLI